MKYASFTAQNAISCSKRLMKICRRKSHTRDPRAGFSYGEHFPDSVNEPEFVKKAIEHKVAVVPGETFNCDTSMPSQSFRMNYSTPSDEDIVRGVKLLAQTAKEMIK